MAFNPSTTIFLCNVDFDNTYKNVRYFKTRGAQLEYFMSTVVRRFEKYVTVRKKLPNGGTVSTVQVEANIEALRALPCNYMIYQNANHGERFFYSFITDLIYINPDVTEIQFETDVFQTWFHDVEIMPSYVVREHAATDGIGEHIVPEKFGVEEYRYTKLPVVNRCENWGYLLCCSKSNEANAPKGTVYSGIYQGLYFYYFAAADVQELNNMLVELESEGSDSVVSIAVVPEFNVSLNHLGTGGGERLFSSDEPRSVDIDVPISDAGSAFGSYTPKNNKLHTYPYEALICTNHSGQEVEYLLEDFTDRNAIQFKLYGDVSASPSLSMIPRNYQGISTNYDAGISITGFPQCAFNSDTFKLWAAKNMFGTVVDTAVNVGKIVGGVAALSSVPATGGASAPVAGGAGIAMIGSGAAGIASTIGNYVKASKEPNRTAGGGAKNNLLTAMGYNRFDFYIRRIKAAHARTIDDYFTMFGYQTNRVKIPSLSSRPYFNYVQTADVNIIGGVPQDDLTHLKNIFNSGVTLWKSGCAVGNYSVNNGVSDT